MKSLLSRVVKEAFEVDGQRFAEAVDNIVNLLSGENGEIGGVQILGRVVLLEPRGEALVIGDLHGDLESLVDILRESDFIDKMNQRTDAFLIFLGDYGDRGAFSAEVYWLVLKLKKLFPKQVILLRGNHEGPESLLAYPHDLPEQFQKRFKDKGGEAYRKIRQLFDFLYNAALVKKKCLLIHGGLSQQVSRIEDLGVAHESFLEDILWSDPTETAGMVYPSTRGAGKLFGKSVTDDVLMKLDVKLLIRGHEPCDEGYRINHGGKVLTLFSRKGAPYFNVHGAYLDLDLSLPLESAEDLIPYIHKI
ncbi:MAG: metallophosphoesterase family protein [Candidatus Bathyarchaeota archaeon]|nr:metallophosphoesterase family protein [Candidatus Bathyarchaeota archaeon]